MNREQLEHVVRAAGIIADDTEIIIIGSQAILGQFPDAPEELCRSMEADVWPKNRPERWELIDGSIGELSPFHETFGYYAQGVGPETAVLPSGWERRLVTIDTPRMRGVVGRSLEVHDLVISKLVAGREKDLEFVRAVVAHDLADRATLEERLAVTDVDDDRRRLIAGLIRRLFERA